MWLLLPTDAAAFIGDTGDSGDTGATAPTGTTVDTGSPTTETGQPPATTPDDTADDTADDTGGDTGEDTGSLVFAATLAGEVGGCHCTVGLAPSMSIGWVLAGLLILRRCRP